MRKSRLSQDKQNHLMEHFVAGTTARTAASLVGVNKTTAARCPGAPPQPGERGNRGGDPCPCLGTPEPRTLAGGRTDAEGCSGVTGRCVRGVESS